MENEKDTIIEIRKRFCSVFHDVKELSALLNDDVANCVPISTYEMGRLVFAVGAMAAVHGRAADAKFKEAVKLFRESPEVLEDVYGQIVVNKEEKGI